MASHISPCARTCIGTFRNLSEIFHRNFKGFETFRTAFRTAFAMSETLEHTSQLVSHTVSEYVSNDISRDLRVRIGLSFGALVSIISVVELAKRMNGGQTVLLFHMFLPPLTACDLSCVLDALDFFVCFGLLIFFVTEAIAHVSKES